jgi:hypothetical protein
MIIDSPIISGSYAASGSLNQLGNVVITGSLTVTGDITGNITGSATNAVSASFATTAVSASYAANTTSASYAAAATSASYANNATSASYALNSTSASYAVASTSASYAANATSASFSSTASYLENYIPPFPFTGSAGISGSLTVNGNITAQTLIVQTITSSEDFVTGSTHFGSIIDNTHQFTGSVTISGSLAVNGSNVVLTNQTGAMSVATASYIETAQTASYVQTAQTASYVQTAQTASFVQNAQTASYVLNAVSSSYAVSSSNASTASYVENAQTASFVQTAQTASFVANAQSASYVLNAVSASYVLNAVSASYAASASNASAAASASYALTASFAANVPATASFAVSASQSQNAVSSSYALTASYSANVPVTASYANNAATSSYALTSSYSLSGGGFPYSGSAEITGSLLVSNLSGTGVRYIVADATGSIFSQTPLTAIKLNQVVTASAGQNTFNIPSGYTTGLIETYINGTKLIRGIEYTDLSGTQIILTTGSFAGDIIEFVVYQPANGVANNVLRQQTVLTASAGQTVFSASYTPGLLDIFYNGSRLSNNEYTANNGTFFTLATASAADDVLDVFVYSYQVGAFSGIGGVGAANQFAYFNTSNSITGSNVITISGSNAIITGSLLGTASLATSAFNAATASYVLTAQTASYAENAQSASYVLNAQTASYVLTAQTASFVANAQSASNAVAAQTASYVLNAISSSFASTASSADDLLVRGTLTAQTLVVQTITSSVDFVTGSTRFGSISENTHQFTGSVSVSGSLTGASASFSSALAANNLTGEGQAGAGGVLNLRQDAIYLPKGNGYSSIASSFSVFEFYGYTGASTYKNFTLKFDGLTDNTRRDYTLPDGSGTLALTGDLINYVTLGTNQSISGAKTFSSPLTGSSAIFSSATTYGIEIFRNNSADSRINITNTTTTSGIDKGLMIGEIGNNGYLYNYQNGSLIFGTNGTDRLTIASTGAVTLSGTSANNLIIDGTNVNDRGTNMVFRSLGTHFGYIGSYGSLIGTTSKDMSIWATEGNGFRVFTNGFNIRLQITSDGTVQPGANGTQDLGTSSLRWATVYTSDLSMSNGIGDYTIVEGEEDLFLYNNKTNKVFKFVLAEVDPSVAPPKKS